MSRVLLATLVFLIAAAFAAVALGRFGAGDTAGALWIGATALIFLGIAIAAGRSR